MKKTHINAHEELLRSDGYKVTPPRMAILEALSEQKKPISAENLYEKVKKLGVNLVTVYRTIASFEKSGLVKKVDLHSDSHLYELKNDHHHHLVCTDCGKLEDFELCEATMLGEKILKKSRSFALINDHSFEFFGLCSACAK